MVFFILTGTVLGEGLGLEEGEVNGAVGRGRRARQGRGRQEGRAREEDSRKEKVAEETQREGMTQTGRGSGPKMPPFI